MRLVAPLLVCQLVQASPALPELYRSVVVDHFLHRYNAWDQPFSELDTGDSKFSSKRGVETNQITEERERVARPVSGTISPFVNLGGPVLPHHQSQLRFSAPRQESLFAPVSTHNGASFKATSSPLQTLPSFDQVPAAAGESPVVMKPFTFFNIPGPVQPVQKAIHQPVHQPVQLPVQQPVLEPVQHALHVQAPEAERQGKELFPGAGAGGDEELPVAPPASPGVFQLAPQTRLELLPATNTISQSRITGEKFPTPDDDIINNIVPTVSQNNDKPFNIFEYISRPTANRGVRQKISPGKMGKMGKMDALKILMKIAGDDWERDLVMGAKEEHGSISSAGEKVSFLCPASEGNFPDSSRCDVYYSCAGGLAHRYSCHSGLQWNILNNVCDWADSVDCSLNREFYSGRSPAP